MTTPGEGLALVDRDGRFLTTNKAFRSAGGAGDDKSLIYPGDLVVKEDKGAVADAVSIPVIASGGVAAVADIEALMARPGVPIQGAILGRSLYNGAITPADAIRVARRKAAA